MGIFILGLLCGITIIGLLVLLGVDLVQNKREKQEQGEEDDEF